MSILVRHRQRLVFFWVAFAVATIAAAVSVRVLYDMVRREISEQGERALQDELAKARARINDYTTSVRRATIAELAGLHVDGLSGALRRWDEGNAVVVGTFEWDAARGFLPGGSFSTEGSGGEELVALWADVPTWRASHPDATNRGPVETGAFVTRRTRTVDNPEFPVASLGYQGENLEMLSYAGRKVDPWAGWAGRRGDGRARWVFWYRAGPDAAVRGCLVDVAPIVAQLRADLGRSPLARIELVSGPSPVDVRVDDSIGSELPGYVLTLASGDFFIEKRSRAQMSVLVVALLFGLFLVGVIFLVLYSRRELRDAARKATFVAQVSHELRTPLTSIRMFADMLGMPGLSEEKRAKFAGTISRESERLGGMIERLLTFNALEQGRQQISVEPVDVAALARETLDEMEATLHAAGLRTESVLPSGSLMASGDRGAFKQALLNLLDNATKYARDGGIVRVDLSTSRGTVCLRVADHGPGIAGGLRARVFDPFVQGGHTLTDKSPGVGLGLSIARGLLRAAGGDLVLVPSDTGAVFEIRMPAISHP